MTRKRMCAACLLELHCTDCGKLSEEYTSQKTSILHTDFKINRRIVPAASANGIGFSQEKVCTNGYAPANE